MVPRVGYVADSSPESREVGDVLRTSRMDVELLGWDANADWGDFDVVVVNQDPGSARPEFLKWARAVEEQTLLANSARTLARTSDRGHLRDLHAGGVSLVPTWWVEPGDDPEALELAGPVQVRASRGAGSGVRVEAPAAVAAVRDIVGAGGTALVQGLADDPRTQVVVVGDRPTHAVDDHGHRVPLDDALAAAARQVLSVGDYDDLLYATLTFRAHADQCLLVDVEACAPGIHSAAHPEVGQELTRALRARISPDVRDSVR